MVVELGLNNVTTLSIPSDSLTFNVAVLQTPIFTGQSQAGDSSAAIESKGPSSGYSSSLPDSLLCQATISTPQVSEPEPGPSRISQAAAAVGEAALLTLCSLCGENVHSDL